MILSHITWPKLKSDFDSDDDDEDDASVEAITRVTGYLRKFIEHGLFININFPKFPLLFPVNSAQLNFESTHLRII